MLLSFFVSALILPTLTFAAPLTVDCNTQDKDRDGWVVGGDMTSEITCSPTSGGTAVKKRGGGDCVDEGMVTDSAGNQIMAKDIHPTAIDVPSNGIDEDCNGQDAGVAPKTNTDAAGVMANIRSFLTWIVGGISGIILIIGGIMYATAAGEEQKTKRARKAMLGAVVGLVVALLANVIISLVASNIAG